MIDRSAAADLLAMVHRRWRVRRMASTNAFAADRIPELVEVSHVPSLVQMPKACRRTSSAFLRLADALVEAGDGETRMDDG